MEEIRDWPTNAREFAGNNVDSVNEFMYKKYVSWAPPVIFQLE
jgi:hypothetical protein